MNQITALINAVSTDQTTWEGYPNSGYQMYSFASNNLDAPLDIAKDYDFKEAYTAYSGDKLLSYYFIAILQQRLYNGMLRHFLGPKAIVEPQAIAMHVWEWKLRDKVVSEREKKPINHNDWLH